eukprot:TRINITY_DN1863_c0_g2_i1.p1 TRINITY_DN1863_c0_g2~~TRINITY_DN1863_c0_g2_i1.p1  ORF type:complete len:528 (+),score=164.49 TRINITY_DN1863_c0_g2_i1:74-1585(+)
MLIFAVGVACVLQNAVAIQLSPLPESMFALANARSQMSLGAKVRLTNHGYERVLATKDKDAMKAFILRLMDESDMAVKEEDLPKLDEFASHAAESGEYETLPALKKALAMQQWIVSKIKAMASKVVESVHGVADKLHHIMGKSEEEAVEQVSTIHHSTANATSHSKAAHSKPPAKSDASAHSSKQGEHGAPVKSSAEHKDTKNTPTRAKSAKHVAPKSTESVAKVMDDISHQVGVMTHNSDDEQEKAPAVAVTPERVAPRTAVKEIDDMIKDIAGVNSADDDKSKDAVKADVAKESAAEADADRKEENDGAKTAAPPAVDQPEQSAEAEVKAPEQMEARDDAKTVAPPAADQIAEAKVQAPEQVEEKDDANKDVAPPAADQPKQTAEAKVQAPAQGDSAAAANEAAKPTESKEAQQHKPEVPEKAKKAAAAHKSVVTHAVKKKAVAPHYSAASPAHKAQPQHAATSSSEAKAGEKLDRSGSVQTPACAFASVAVALLALLATQ